MSGVVDQFFQSIADAASFPVDQVRYVLLLLLCYPLAYIFRYVLHPSHTSLTTRYIYSVSLGLAMGFMCFGWQMFILFGVVGVSYTFLLVLPPNVVQRYTMIWAMGCMSAAHLYRIVTDFEGYHLDFTGPLMVIVQRVTSVGYAYHDGNAREESSLNEDQKKQMINDRPSLLVYFSYNFNFHSFLAGPMYTIKDYLAMMDGSNLTPPANPNAYARAKEHSKEPSSLYPVLTKLLYALISIGIFVLLSQQYTIENVMDPKHSLLYRIFVSELYIMGIRCRYYFIWLLVDSISNFTGLGFNGYDSRGDAKWDLVTNVFPLEIELGLNLREIINKWNYNSALWLRRTVFERVTFMPTLFTFIVSALWHGFYPGYYMCFITLSLMLEASKKMRRLVRSHFQGTPVLQRFYDVITLVVTQLFLTFATMPFQAMWIGKGLQYWSYFYYIPVIITLIVVFLFPSGRKKAEKGKSNKTSDSTADPNIQAKINAQDNIKLKSN